MKMLEAMNICLVSQEYPPETGGGGIGTQTLNKAQILSRMGNTVHVLCCATNTGPELNTTTEGGIVVHRMQPPRIESGERPINEPAIYWMGYTWLVVQHLQYLMSSTDFDLINFPEYGAEGFAYQLNRRPWNWVPTVVQLHGPVALLSEKMGWPHQDSEFYRLGTFMEGASIRLADALMASSVNIADFVARFYQVPRESIHVVHCGIDTDIFRPTVKRNGPPSRPTVLFVGNVLPSKGVDTAFEAVMRLRCKYPDIVLQILGQGDELAYRLQRQARLAGAAASLELLGFIADRTRLPEIYNRAHVFCSPARHEGGVANVYIEAMACGCPVVASTSGGAPEAITHGETGLLVPPNDVEATAAAIDLLLGDLALRQRMGNTARKRVKEYFAVEKYIDRVLAAYGEAIERSQCKLRSSEGRG